MSRRGDSIFKRKDGRWEARYPKGKDENGKTIYRSLYGKTFNEVKEKREQEMLGNFSTKDPETSKKLLLKDISILWLSWKKVSLKEQTVIKYQDCIDNHISPEIGGYKLSDINATIINQFLFQKIENGLSNNYVRLISIILNSILNYAVKEELMSPIKGQIFKPKGEKKEISVLRRQEQEQLEKFIKTNYSGTNLAIYLALHTGIRIGEICALQWEDVDFAEKVLYVRKSVVRINKNEKSVFQIGDTKTTSSKRTIPLTEHLVEVLKEAKSNSKSSYIISTDNNPNTFVNPRTLEYRYKTILSECGIAIVKFHSLRHTFATRCIECGVDVKSLSEILGHANVNITLEYYVHPNMELKRMAIGKLEADYGQKNGREGI